MAAKITVEDAQATLKDLIHKLAPGEEIIITEDQQPVARLVSEQSHAAKPPRPGPGLCKGVILYMASDFDAPLDEMREFIE